MNFRQTLDEHLRAIRARDLPALVATLPAEDLVLIMADGRLVRSVAEFVEMHRGWFSQSSWTLATELVRLEESPTLGIAVVHLDYRDTPLNGPSLHETSYLTLVFALRDGRWVMVQDQNTPIRGGSSSG
ncbi:MAG TPA: nuclear transport factor 2 family protein [Isosphaeraceae bacterium]